jgi:hypothetical protein
MRAPAKVSKAKIRAYNAWFQRPLSARKIVDQDPVCQIKAVDRETNESCGSPRVDCEQRSQPRLGHFGANEPIERSVKNPWRIRWEQVQMVLAQKVQLCHTPELASAADLSFKCQISIVNNHKPEDENFLPT